MVDGVMPNTRSKMPGDRSRAEYAYDQLKEKLRSGELRAGQRLRETDLADELKISRTPVREALRRIASDGLVEVVAGRGLIVAEFNLNQVRELYELRGLLEGGAAMLATRNASEADIALLRGIIEESAAATTSAERTKQLNEQLHKVIYEVSRNRYLQQALAQLSDSLSILPGTTFSAGGRPEAALHEHGAMVEAMAARDEAAAERLAREHMAKAYAVRVRMMFAKDQGGNGPS